ncbi:MAG TPA: cytochrome C [Candidatus Kapabacteria bacterium]|nr:cytochrome C [Candidatus Kapabacteria bacterium]
MSEGIKNFWEIVSLPDNIPIVLLLILAVFLTIFAFRKALQNDRNGSPIEATQSDRVQVWPYLVRVEFIVSLAIMVILTVWSFALNGPLEEAANPTLTPNPSKAPWYFLGLQEMLVYFDPWIAGVVLPSLIILGLIAIPYIDNNPRGNGYYTFKERKFAILTYCFGFLILWVSLIQIGTFLRGPGWNFFPPGAYWDPHKVVPLTNVDFSELFGIPTKNVDLSINTAAMIFGGIVILAYMAIPVIIWQMKKQVQLFKNLGPYRYFTGAYLFIIMMALPIKMLLRWTLNVKYILVTPFFNI